MLTAVATVEGAFGTHLAFAPDGDRWALADARTLQLGSAETLGPRSTAPSPIHDLAFTRDGGRLLACPDIYDIEKDSWTSTARLDRAIVADLDDPPRPDQLAIVAGAFAVDCQEQAVVTRFQPTRELGAVDSYHGPFERLLLIGADGELRGVLRSGGDEIRAVAVTDSHIAAGGLAVTVWERTTRRQVAVLEHHRLVVRALAAHPVTSRLAAIAADGEVSVWGPATAELVASWPGHEGDGYAVAWHPRRPVLATGGMDDAVRVWSDVGVLLHEEAVGGWPVAVAFDATGSRLGVVVHARPPQLTFFAVDQVAAEHHG